MLRCLQRPVFTTSEWAIAMRSGFIGCSFEQTNFPKFWLQKQDTLRLRSNSINQSYILLPYSSMLIETDKYQPNSLRKGRREGFEKDLSDAYALFAYKHNDPRYATINDFTQFWTQSQLSLIVCLRCEDEEEQEYFQILDHILINEYFLKGNDSKKIYAILCLYFFAYSLDSNGDRNTRYIHVTQEFIVNLSAFLREQAEFSKFLFIKVIKKLRELFIYSIKTGIRNPLIKKNGDTFVRYPKLLKKLNKDNYSSTLLEIKQGLPSLEEVIKSYNEAKEQYLQGLDREQSLAVRKQMRFDKNITLRLEQILKSYQADITYMEEDVKDIEEDMQ